MWISFSREGQIFQSTVWESSASCSSVLPQWLLNSERHVFWQCCGILGTTSKERKKIRKLNWVEIWMLLGSVQFSSVTQSCPTLCDPMDCSTQGLPIHHQLPEFIKLVSIESVMPSNHQCTRVQASVRQLLQDDIPSWPYRGHMTHHLALADQDYANCQ